MTLPASSIAGDTAAARAVFIGTAAQLLSKVVHLALNVVATLALIRYLGPAGYGDYVFVVSFSALFGLLSDFGLPRVAVRDMSRTPEATANILGTALVARLSLATVSWGLAQAVSLVMGTHADLRFGIAVASLLFVSEALLSLTTVFQARLAMQYEGLVTVAAQALDTVLILWLISRNAGLVALLAAPVLSAAAGALLAGLLVWRCFRVGLKIEPPRLLQLLRDAWPVGLTVLLAVVYLKLDSVLLGVFSRQEEVGLYGAAYRPIEYLILASSVLIHPVFPLLARWQGVDARRFKAVFQGGTTALLAVLLPVPVIVCLVADPLVRLLYAPEFAAAAAPLRLLAVAMVFVTFAVWQDFTLLSIGRQRITLAYGAVGVGLNIALNLVLIPQAGAVGAAWAALATGVVFSASAFWACQRFARVAPDPRTTTGLLLANASLAGILWVLLQTGLNWPIATFGAGLAYLGLLFVFQVTSVAELHQLLPKPSPAPDNPPLLEAA